MYRFALAALLRLLVAIFIASTICISHFKYTGNIVLPSAMNTMPARVPLENETREIQCELLWAIPKKSKAKKKKRKEIKLFEETFVIMLGNTKNPSSH